MIPLTVIAELATPPVVDRPLMLDALLWAAVAEETAYGDATGWADVPDERALPLVRVETPYGWWWAASAVHPLGPEARDHLNRVPLVEEYARWTPARSVNHASGPDKRLRKPYYYRPGMLRLVWTCVGERARVAELLAQVGGVGALRGHGHGWVQRWRVDEGGPPASAYASDVTLRHLPAEVRIDAPEATRRQMPLRPPYHARRASVPCWQVT